VELVEMIVAKVLAAPVVQDPFPHVVIQELLPSALYEAALIAIPPKSELTKVSYPGTGYSLTGRGGRSDFGYAYLGMQADDGVLGVIHKAFSSPAFARALLDAFSAQEGSKTPAIPAAKRAYFANGATDYSTVFDLQIDLPGYAIAPHPDVPSKIVTFQTYLTSTDELAQFGTFLCRPKPGVRVERLKPITWLARGIEFLPKRFYQTLERSRIGLALGLGATRNWYQWSRFDLVKVVPAVPNSFLAFAPNERSFHAVDLSIPESFGTRERCVVRGFIRQGRDTTNWIAEISAPPR